MAIRTKRFGEEEGAKEMDLEESRLESLLSTLLQVGRELRQREQMIHVEGVPATATDPFETLVQTIPRRRTSSLNVPDPLPEGVETKLVGNLGGVHGVWQILRCQDSTSAGSPVCWQRPKAEHRAARPRSAYVALSRQRRARACQLTFLSRLGDTLSVIRVDDENDSLGVLEVYGQPHHPESLQCLQSGRILS